MLVRESFVSDYSLLQQRFAEHVAAAEAGQPGWASFAEAWRDLRFECVHIACRPEFGQYRELLLEVYHHISLHLDPELPWITQLGAVFALFAVHSTSIDDPANEVPIRITPKVWSQLTALWRLGTDRRDPEFSCHPGAAEAAQVIEELCRARVFDFVATALHRKHVPALTREAALGGLDLIYSANGGSGRRSIGTIPVHVADDYHRAKQSLHAARIGVAHSGTTTSLLPHVAQESLTELPADLQHANRDFAAKLTAFKETFVQERGSRIRSILRKGSPRRTKRQRRVTSAFESSPGERSHAVAESTTDTPQPSMLRPTETVAARASSEYLSMPTF